MRLVAGQKYVRGPAGEIMPYSPAVDKIHGCEVFVQKTDQSDSMQLPENENLPKFRGRRMVDNSTDTKQLPDYAASVVEKPVAKEIKAVRPKPVAAKKTFEAEFDLRDEMEQDLKHAVEEPSELE